jgi:hypothetical protein
MPTIRSNKPNDPLNFSKKHPLFEIYLDKKGPEFSEIDDRRLEYINKYAGKVPLTEIPIPKNIPGTVWQTQDWSPRPAIYLQTGYYGDPHLPLNETESLTSIPTASTPESSFPSSFPSFSTDGGATPLMPSTRSDMRIMTSILAIFTINWIPALYHPLKSGLDQDDTFKSLTTTSELDW